MKRPAIKGPEIKAPPFLRDLYRDLRDRRLLPLVAVLLIAIPALPLVLGTSSERPPPPPAPTALAEEDLPTMPAVLASDPGLRDYHERLESLRSKNPFAQDADVPSAKAAKAASITKVVSENAGDAAATAATSATGSSSEVTPGSSTETSTSTTETSTTETTDTTTGGGGGGDDDVTHDQVAYRVDVRVGRAGQLERRRDVKLMSVLPSQSNPVLVYLGASEDGKEAVFLVSEDVVRSHGAGHCLPTAADCEFLSLRKGDERKLEYAPHGEPDTFVIDLIDINLSKVRDERDSSSDDGGKSRGSARAGLKEFFGL